MVRDLGLSFNLALTFFNFVALDDRIDDFAEIVRREYKVDELGDPAAVTEVCQNSSHSIP